MENKLYYVGYDVPGLYDPAEKMRIYKIVEFKSLEECEAKYLKTENRYKGKYEPNEIRVATIDEITWAIEFIMGLDSKAMKDFNKKMDDNNCENCEHYNKNNPSVFITVCDAGDACIGFKHRNLT